MARQPKTILPFCVTILRGGHLESPSPTKHYTNLERQNQPNQVSQLHKGYPIPCFGGFKTEMFGREAFFSCEFPAVTIKQLSKKQTRTIKGATTLPDGFYDMFGAPKSVHRRF